MLRETAKKRSDAAIIAFIDSDDFAPGSDGMYDNKDEIRKQVIAQALVNKELGLFEFTPDPFGYGKYTEPK